MNADKIKQFMSLAGQFHTDDYRLGTPKERELGAKLLLSEVLEYVVKGLGVVPSFNGVEIDQPDALEYRAHTSEPNQLEMIDGLADVAYTMYWNAAAFGLPLEESFELVCDNNLEKFVALETEGTLLGRLEKTQWDLGVDVSWPDEVASVEVIQVQCQFFAVGKDHSGKVKKPSTYRSVDLSPLLK